MDSVSRLDTYDELEPTDKVQQIGWNTRGHTFCDDLSRISRNCPELQFWGSGEHGPEGQGQSFWLLCAIIERGEIRLRRNRPRPRNPSSWSGSGQMSKVVSEMGYRSKKGIPRHLNYIFQRNTQKIILSEQGMEPGNFDRPHIGTHPKTWVRLQRATVQEVRLAKSLMHGQFFAGFRTLLSPLDERPVRSPYIPIPVVTMSRAARRYDPQPAHF
jgi:hypothetical protein